MVEDSPIRLLILERLYSMHAVTSARTCAAALAKPGEMDFDLIHLDFDLDSENTIPVAQVLARRQQDSLIVIHSANPDGVRQLKNLLPAALYVPARILSASSPAMSRFKSAIANTVARDTKELRLVFKTLAIDRAGSL